MNWTDLWVMGVITLIYLVVIAFVQFVVRPWMHRMAERQERN